MAWIAGTIRNAVRLSVLDNCWQQKKQTLGKKERNQEKTAQERELELYRQQAQDIREQDRLSEITNKLKSGQALTPEELAYLRQNNPEALKEYEEIQQERESYRRQLRNCKSREDVEKLKVSRLSSYAAQAKKISTNPYIPKNAKVGLIGKLQAKTAAVQEEHMDFVRSARYLNLPDKQYEPDPEDIVEENEGGATAEDIAGAETGSIAEAAGGAETGSNAEKTEPPAEVPKQNIKKTIPVKPEEISGADTGYLQNQRSRKRIDIHI